MFSYTPNQFLITLACVLTVIGIISFAAGVIIIFLRAMGADVRTIAAQTTKLAEKGIAEDVSGLVGNASALIDSLTQLVKTTSGLGAFLIINGIVFFAAAYIIVSRL